MKKPIFLPAVTLALAALILFGAAIGLNGIAAKNAQAEHLQLMQTLLPGSTAFTVEPYSGEDANIRSVHKGENGYVIETVTYGYAGEITMYIGVSDAGKVTGLVVRDLSETFGLGREALTDHVFLAQFLNSSGTFAVATAGADAFSGATGTVEEADGDTVDVDALTGATVTSKAIVRCVNSAVAYVTGADAVSEATSWGG
nr:FMN-binding protein [Oscillospiraceae bacterium]